ncbi:RRM domain-containing protein [Mycena indigotica]|uniref:RRM domain-containing protein n=1 Tax=Mycena indigotica TaxID=2126181 RepID=A0A8H6SK63_9AGAR|nr:RRM domain-containing protein [Mycena indigotica]KAF7299335.1 RRM domain-containing protein [Mycena indigotica]
MTHSVNVSGISSATTEANVHDFFTFCGKIDKIDFHGTTATIHFEKSSAAKTAVMLNGGTLDGATLTVTSDKEHEDDHTDDSHPIQQSDKPRAGIAAEYLAKGYILGDHILTRAIDIDNKQGISKKFLSYLSSVDSAVGAKALGQGQTLSGKATETVTTATQQAKSFDEQKGYSKSATDFFNQYYYKALSSPWGARVRDFYTTTSKQVLDIHEEAKRIHAEHQTTTANAPAAAPAPASEEKKTA